MFKKYFCVFLIVLFIGNAAAGFNIRDFLKDTVKKAAIGSLIREMSSPINSFINNLLVNHNAENKQKTLVVPVFTVGGGSAVGAAQVSGPDHAVNQVKSVIAVEDEMNEKYRVKAYIPSSSSNPLKMNRVSGVGVTAIIEGFI
ncbi:MAG: hypothetical protein ACQESP_03980 [Candidatus Muiribacteriota bacterium]